jgi:hypothetical protein
MIMEFKFNVQINASLRSSPDVERAKHEKLIKRAVINFRRLLLDSKAFYAFIVVYFGAF